MVRLGKFGVISGSLCIALALYTPAALPQDDALLDEYLFEIERLISNDDLEGARDKLNEAQTVNLRDERLEVVQGQLRLLESLSASEPGELKQNGSEQTGSGQTGSEQTVSFSATGDGNNTLTKQDKLAATDLLDSLRVAMENGELAKVRLFTETTERTDSLLDAVFNNYAALRVVVSEPEADEATQSFLATLEFKELTTRDGDTAFPAQAWRQHRLRIVKSDGSWQKVLW